MNTESKTPRTDAEQKYLFSLNGQMQTICVHADFARQLERELNEANYLFLKTHLAYEAAHAVVVKLQSEREQWKQDAERLAHALHCADNSYFGSPNGQKQIDEALTQHNQLTGKQ
jgi:hypothetical protein